MATLRKYEAGEKVGLLFYVGEAGRSETYKRRLCEFKCKCGKHFITLATSATNGMTKSCGCRRYGRTYSKLTSQQASEIKKLIWEEDEFLRVIAEKYDVSIGTIWNIKAEKLFKNVA